MTLIASLHAKSNVVSEVHSVDKCDVILAFCPLVSQHEKDVKAALKNIPGNVTCQFLHTDVCVE